MNALAGKIALAIETSTRCGSIAWRAGEASDGETGRIALDPERSHGSDLMPAVDAAMRNAGATPRDVGLVAVGTGPGSYTGLRVGTATALGIARGTGADLVGVPSLEGIAHSEFEDRERGIVLRNAFGGQVYLAAYERNGYGDVSVRIAPMSCPYDDVPRLVAEAKIEGTWLCDERAGAEFVNREIRKPDRLRVAADAGAVDILTLALARRHQRDACGSEGIKPLYIRPFEAKNRRR